MMKMMLRSALALNNAGVTLLERGRTEDALKTFADSIFAMHTFLVEDEADESHSEPIESRPKRSVDDLIHCANARLTQTSPPPCNPNPARQFSVCPIDHDWDGMHSAFKLRPTPSCLSPVRFRGNPLNDSDDQPDMDLISSTIMYNKGLSHFLAASSCASAKTRDKHLKVAATSFTMSHSMLTNQLESCQGLVFSEFWNLQLNSLVLTYLMQVYQDQGSTHHVQCVSNCLTDVLQLVEHYHGNIVSMQFVVGNHGLAPAA